MKVTITALIAALALNAYPFDDAHRIILIRGRVNQGEITPWLSIECRSQTWKDDGFDPDRTVAVSNFYPLINKTPTGQWEIQFYAPRKTH